jgi:hypothetical protein
MEDQILSSRIEDPNRKDKSDSHQFRARATERERQKYSFSDFYGNHGDGHRRRAKERTNTDAKTNATITLFPVKKSDTLFSMRSRTIRSNQSTSEMVRRSKSRTSGNSTMASYADNCIHMYI